MLQSSLNNSLTRGNSAEITSWGMPDYDSAIAISKGNYTAPSNGLIISSGYTGTGGMYQYVKNVKFYAYGNSAAGSTFIIPVSSGQTVTVSSWVGNSSYFFVPLKGA